MNNKMLRLVLTALLVLSLLGAVTVAPYAQAGGTVGARTGAPSGGVSVGDAPAGGEPAGGGDEIKIIFNGEEKKFEPSPVIVDGRTLVPMRDIFEALAAEVTWDSATKTISAKIETTDVSMEVGKKIMKKNNQQIHLDVPPMIIGEKTMVPLKAVSLAFGTNVVWNGEDRTVTITHYTVPCC